MAALPELLAPAGTPEAGYAALHYGADAVYLGLSRFSARAEAGNFTPGDLADFVGHAHRLVPRRNVYLALNTLVENGESAAAAETLFLGALAGVDAVIVQDLGVMRLARDSFPGLSRHASTQMAIHNLEGALAARDMGFRRVTLARELTMEEIRRITLESGLEVETFIHGALCYAYSGLCLFSALSSGRSGNRGRCSYPCRAEARIAGRPETCHPFSLKDLALCGRARELAGAGVASLKIEGRKKSPLYVAAVVDYYRRLLDGTLDDRGAAVLEARMQTIFARPWTTFFLDGVRNPEAADIDVVGHRGAPLGEIRKVIRSGGGKAVVFRAGLPVERHDGIQTDIPGETSPYGFPVNRLFRLENGGRRSVFAVSAGEEAAVDLPEDAPGLSPGQPLYLASSQAVKRAYPFDRPKPGSAREPGIANWTLDVRRGDKPGTAVVACRARKALPAAYRCLAALAPDASGFGEAVWEVRREVEAFPARDPAGAETAAKTAFSRLGDFGLAMGTWGFANPDGMFVRPKTWNEIRRDAAAGLLAAAETCGQPILDGWIAGVRETAAPGAGDPGRPKATVHVDRPEQFGRFSQNDFDLVDECIVDVPRGNLSARKDALERLSERTGRDKIRVAFPIVERDAFGGRDDAGVRRLCDAGYRRWMVPGLAGWRALRDLGVDLAADWPLYAFNRLSAAELLAGGFASFTLSPEDGVDNMERTARAFPGRARLSAWMHPPMFISAACAHSHLGRCMAGADGACSGPPPLAISIAGGLDLTTVPSRCGSVTTRDHALDMTDRIERLGASGLGFVGADFRWRAFSADDVVRLWRIIRKALDARS